MHHSDLRRRFEASKARNLVVPPQGVRCSRLPDHRKPPEAPSFGTQTAIARAGRCSRCRASHTHSGVRTGNNADVPPRDTRCSRPSDRRRRCVVPNCDTGAVLPQGRRCSHYRAMRTYSGVRTASHSDAARRGARCSRRPGHRRPCEAPSSGARVAPPRAKRCNRYCAKRTCSGLRPSTRAGAQPGGVERRRHTTAHRRLCGARRLILPVALPRGCQCTTPLDLRRRVEA